MFMLMLLYFYYVLKHLENYSEDRPPLREALRNEVMDTYVCPVYEKVEMMQVGQIFIWP